MAGVSQGHISKAKKAKKHRVAFKFSFRATEVPKDWEKLVVSMVSPSTGKASLKTSKALVKDGVCAWIETVMKSTKLAVGPDESSYEPKIYSFVVSKGSTRSDILGQAEMDVGILAMSNKEAHISLLLRNCIAGTRLHVVVQCNTPRPGRRPLDRLSWPRQSDSQISTVPQHKMAQSSVGWVAQTHETRMLRERIAESGSSMQLYPRTQKKLVEHLHTVIRNLAEDIAALEEQLRGAAIQIRSAHDKAPVIELPSGKELDDKNTHLEVGKSDLKELLYGSAVQGSFTRSELPENEQLPACERFEAKNIGDFLLGSDVVDRLPDRDGSSENEINYLFDNLLLQTAERAELQFKIDELEKFKAQLESRLSEEQKNKYQLFQQAILHSEAIEGMDAKIQDLELVKADLESQLHEAMEDVRHRESQIEELHQEIPGKEFGGKSDSQCLGPADVETLLDRIGRSENQLKEYLERHHVPGTQRFEYESKVQRLQSLTVQLESQLAEEHKKNTDLMDMLQLCTSATIDRDAKVAQLEKSKRELEKHLLHALEAAKHTRAHLDELQELLRVLEAHFENLTQEEKNLSRDEGDKLTAGTGEMARFALEHQLTEALEVRGLTGANLQQSWEQIAGQERPEKLEVLGSTEVETLLNRTDRSEEKTNMMSEYHVVPGSECADLELKRTGLEALKSQLEVPLLQESKSSKYQLDDLMMGLDEHTSTARELEARILTAQLGKEELQQHLLDAVEGRKHDKAHIKKLCEKLEKAQVSSCFEMEAVLSRIDQSEEQIKHFLEYYLMGNSKQLEMEEAVGGLESSRAQLCEETKTTQNQLDEFWQQEALKSEDAVLQNQLSQAQGEVKLLRGKLRETQEEINTQTPYQVSLVMNVESKDEALERQLFEAREEGRITRSQSQELHRHLNHKIASLQQAEAKIRDLEVTRSSLEDQLSEERRQSSYRLDFLQARVAGFERQIEKKFDELQMARAAFEIRMQEYQIGLDCTESSDGFEHKQTEDDPGVKIIQDGGEFAAGHRWLNFFEEENNLFLHTISKLEKLVVSLLSEKAHLGKALSRYHVELEARKTCMVQLENQSPQHVALVMNIVARDQAIDKQLLEAQEEGRLSRSQLRDLHRQLAVQLTANSSQNDCIAEMESRVKRLETVRITLEDQLFTSQEEKRQSLSHLDLLGVHIAVCDKEIDCQVEQLRKARTGLEWRLQEFEIDFEVENGSNHVLLHPDGGGGDDHKLTCLEQLKASEREYVKVFHIISKLEGLIVSLSRDRTELRIHLANMQKEIEERRSQPPERVALVMHVEARDEMIQRQFQEAQEEGRLTKAQVQQLHSQLNVQLRTIKELELQVIELESTRISLEEQVAHSQEDRRQRLSDIGVLQLRIATFDKEIESRVDDLQKAKASLEDRLNELQIVFEVGDGKLKHEALGVAFSNSGLGTRFKLPETKNAGCLEIIPNLEKQIVTFSRQRADLETQLDPCQNELASCIGNQDPCVEPSHQFPLMNLAAKEPVHRELHKVQKDHDSSSQNIALKDQLFAQVELIKHFEAKIGGLESMNSKLEDQLRQSHEERRQSMSHLDTLQVQLEAFDGEIESKIEDLRKARASLESKMQIFQADVKDVTGSESMHLSICEYGEVDEDSGSGRDSTFPQSNTKLQAQVKAFENENARFVQMHAKLETQLSSLVGERDRYKAESKRAKEELTDLRSQIETHLSAKLRVETTALALGQSNEDLESQLKEFEDGNAQLSSTVSELEQKLEWLTEENAHYKLRTDPQESMTPFTGTEHQEEMNLHDIAEDNLQLMHTVARLESELVRASEELASVKSKLEIVDVGILHTALEKHSDKHVTDLEAEVTELRRSKDELEHELGEKIEGLLVALDEQEERAVRAQDSIHELRLEHNHELENMKAEIRQHTEELVTTVGGKDRRAVQAMQEASELRSEELVWKERMRQMQELVRQAAGEAASIKAEFDARVQDLVAECHISKEQERDIQLRLQEALKELDEVKARGKSSRQGHRKQGSAAELFQAQLDISRLAIEQLIETERRALEASLQRLEAGKRLAVDKNDGKTLCQATENVYPPCGHCVGVESHIPKTRVGDDHCGEESDERRALTVHGKQKLKGKGQTLGLQGERRGVSHPCRSQGSPANVTFPSDKHIQVWNSTLSTLLPSHEVIIAPLAQHRECLYYLDELQYLWLRFRGLAES